MKIGWTWVLMLFVVMLSGCWPQLSFVGSGTYTVRLVGTVTSTDPEAILNMMYVWNEKETHRKEVSLQNDGSFSVDWPTLHKHGPWLLQFQPAGHHPAQITVTPSEALLELEFQPFEGRSVSGTLDYQMRLLPEIAAVVDLDWAPLAPFNDPTVGSDSSPGIVLATNNPDVLSPWQAAATVRYHTHAGIWSLSDLPLESAEDIYRELAAHPDISWIDWNTAVAAQTIAGPNDPLYQEQWHYELIYMPEAWTITTGRRQPPVRVAVLDTLADRAHPDLQANLQTVQSLTSRGTARHHGTHVAGILGATTNNSRGVAGTMWTTDLRSYGVLNGGGTDAHLADGIALAVEDGAQILNLSLGGGNLPASHTVIRQAHADNVTIVAAAGNIGGSGCSEFQSSPHCTLYPAAYPEVIAVGAVEVGPMGKSQVASYSLLGPETDPVLLFAPGGSRSGAGILSTTVSAGYTEDRGTSMATPMVSGIVGLMLSVDPGLTPTAVWERLYTTGIGLPFDHQPRRLVNAYAAVTGSYLEQTWVGFTALEGAYQGLTYWVPTQPERQWAGTIPLGRYELTARIPVRANADWVFTESVTIAADGDHPGIAVNLWVE